MAANWEEVSEYFRSGEATVEQLVELRDKINKQIPVEVEEEEPPYWEGEKSTEIKLGNEVIPLLQVGRPQLDQIGKLREWLDAWARPLMEGAVKSAKAGDAKKEDDDTGKLGIDMVLQLLNPDALLELGCLLIMRDEEFVEEYFDIGWVLDVVGKIVKQQTAIRRLTQGFFGRFG